MLGTVYIHVLMQLELGLITETSVIYTAPTKSGTWGTFLIAWQVSIATAYT